MQELRETAWSPVTPTTLADQVYERMRKRILRGELAPGQFLREQELSEALGVSRTPVRYAMARLTSEGFLVRLPHRGYQIPTESIENLLQLYPIITALELMAGRASLPYLTAADLAELRAVNQRLEQVQSEKLRSAVIDANHEFHRLLSARCGNRALRSLLEELRAKTARLEFWSVDQPVHLAEAIEQHEKILQAIEGKEYTEALRLLKENRLQTYTAFREELGTSEVDRDEDIDFSTFDEPPPDVGRGGFHEGGA